MLLPGTFLGVWNLLAISNHRAANSVSRAWIQAHGHAQIFGWIGTFILGIGFYSIPKLRRMNSFALSVVWSCWALWTGGVTLRGWLASTSGIGGHCFRSRPYWNLLLSCSSFALFPATGHKDRARPNWKTGSSWSLRAPWACSSHFWSTLE